MANFFEQFDAPESRQESNFFARFEKPGAQSPSVVRDMARSAVSGIEKGTATIAGLPGDVGNLFNAGGEAAVRWSFNQMGASPEQINETLSAIKKGREQGAMRGVPDSADVRRGIESIAGPMHKPQTVPGQYTESVFENVPGAVLGPGGMARNAVNFAVVPGLVGEAAHQATKGTSLEPYAKPITSIASGGIAGAINRPNVVGQAIAQGSKGVTEPQVAAAESMFAEAQQIGLPITRAEAMQYATNGATRLGDLQRVVEGAGGLKPEFSARPAQVESAGRQAMDTIAPANMAPSNIGPTAAREATGVVNDVRDTINNATRSIYQSSAGNLVPAPVHATMLADPLFADALASLRNDPAKNSFVRNQSDRSVAVYDAVKQELRERAINAAKPISQNASQAVASATGGMADTVKGVAIAADRQAVGGPSAYEAALATQERLRNQYLNPLLNGPIGKIADTPDTKAAIEALFPRNPLPNSADEIGAAVGTLARRNPDAARDLVRAHVEGVFNEATRSLQAGPAQWGGAGFAAAVRGNPQQAQNLEAAVRALPAGGLTWQGFDRLLQIMEAQGTRQRVGSQTSFNDIIKDELKRGGTIGEATTAALGVGLNLPRRVAERVEQWRLGSNVDELARLLTDPNAGPTFRRLALATDYDTARVNAMRLVYLGRDLAPESGK